MLYKNERENENTPNENSQDRIEETIAASFPASDMSAWAGATAHHGEKDHNQQKKLTLYDTGCHCIVKEAQ